MCRLNVTRKWNSGYDNATRNGLQEVVTIMRLKWWYKEWYKNGWQYPAISERSFSGKESNFSNAERQTWHTRWHFAMPHRMADFSPFVLWGTRNFRSILLRQTRERRRKFALSHRTPSPSITAATVLSAEMRPRYTRRIQRARFAVEYIENLTSGTPVKLTANNLYRDTKAESNRLNLVGIPRETVHEDIDS